MKKLLLLLLLMSKMAISQNINIPDTAFKHVLISHIPLIDSNLDNEISIAEALAFKDTITRSFISSGVIYDLTGLEEFINITGFHIENMGITYIDLTANTRLKYVDLTDNFYLDSNIDMSLHDSLTYFSIENTQVKAVDLQNGNNSNITYCYVYPANCVRVDTVSYSSSAPNWFESNISVYTTSPCFATTTIDEVNELVYTIYPNPVSDQLNINNFQKNDIVYLMDLQGKVLSTQQTGNIQIGHFPSGIYIVKILSNNNKTFTQKVVKL